MKGDSGRRIFTEEESNFSHSFLLLSSLVGVIESVEIRALAQFTDICSVGVLRGPIQKERGKEMKEVETNVYDLLTIEAFFVVRSWAGPERRMVSR